MYWCMGKFDANTSERMTWVQKKKHNKKPTRILRLDQGWLVCLYPGIEHLPEVGHDGLVDMSPVRVNLSDSQ